jgi:uncharacterized membrane protein
MVLPRKKKKKAKTKKRPQGFFLRGIVTILPIVLTLFILMTVLRFAQDYVTTPINRTIYWSLERNQVGWGLLQKKNIHPLDQEYLNTDTLPEELRNLAYREGINSPSFTNMLALHRDEEMSGDFFYNLEDLGIDEDLLRKDSSKVVHPLIGVLLSIVVVLVLGSLTSGFVGRRVIASIDRGVQQIPVVRSVYPYTKQLVDFFLTETEFEFDTVVAAPYPNADIYAIAFVTSEGMKTINDAMGDKRYVSMFVPTSPMPMTGYTVFIDADKLIPLPISVDEALRVTISAGVLIPPHERVEELESAMEALGAELDSDSDKEDETA